VEGIRDAIEGAIAYLRAHPDEARYTDSAATARIASGLRVLVTGPSGESLESDMVPAVGGSGSAPSPGWLLRAAEASCVATLIAMRAAQQSRDIALLEVTVDSISDDRGILGIDPETPAGPLSTRIAVRLGLEEGSEADAQEIVGWAVDHCPVADAVRRAVPVSVEVVVSNRS
jgi:uncharacterized OsmC-like protein